MMKKLVSVIMAVVMLISAFSFSTFAAFQKDSDVTEYPVILVPGFSSAALRLTNEDGTDTKVWTLDFDAIKEHVLKNPRDLIFGVLELLLGNSKRLGKLVGTEFVKAAKYLACDGNGKSIYNVSVYTTDPALTNREYLKDNGDQYIYQHEPEIMKEASKFIDNKNIFSFNCDFRMGTIECAACLDEYIESVLEYTKAEKVNLYGTSHGGQITGTYLSLYADKNEVDNVVMTIPALGGAGIAYDDLNGKFDFNEYLLAQYLEHGYMSETDYHILLKAQQLGFLDGVLDEASIYINEILGNWGSIWDFLPCKYYDELKAKLLDEKENADIIAESDRMHYEIIPNYGKAFAHCRDLGMNVSIIAGSGLDVLTGDKENSDCIITLEGATGATCAPYGEQFPSGYKQVIPSDHYYVSPSMEVDASTAYMPDNTWFVDGLFHGMTYKDEYTKELMYTLMLTDRLTSVWDDPEFPQYHATTNPSSEVFGKFNASREGYLSDADNSFMVQNICKEHSITILSVKCNGADIKFGKAFKTLAPGESMDISVSGSLPKTSLTTCTVTITFWESDCLTPYGTRTLDFTLMNS